MRLREILLAVCCISTPWAATADITTCELTPAEAHDFVSGSLRIYSDEDGFIHSILLEGRTDYEDDIPYLFSCDINCVMDLEGDIYTYRLLVTPGGSRPETVKLKTSARDRDFRSDDTFDVVACHADISAERAPSVE